MTASDPTLDQLLFVIALTKGAIALGALAALRWRLAQPISSRLCASYAISALAMILATGLLLAHSALALVPFLFEGGLVTMVLLGLRDAELLAALTGRFSTADAARRARALSPLAQQPLAPDPHASPSAAPPAADRPDVSPASAHELLRRHRPDSRRAARPAA